MVPVKPLPNDTPRARSVVRYWCVLTAMGIRTLVQRG